jgi:histidine triad (HIT) family protein
MDTVYNTNNIFARILRGEIACKQVAQNDYALAFDDVSPLAPVHVLIVPKGAYTDAADFANRASDAEKAGLWNILPQVLAAKNVNNGFRMIANTGVHGGQEVPHLHWHILAGTMLGRMLGARHDKEI